MSSHLSADDLLAGAASRHRLTLPESVLPSGSAAAGGSVLLRPLTVGDVQRINKAAKDEGLLTSLLMVQQALVEPALTLEQVQRLPAGLAEYLLQQVNRLSGLSLSDDDLEQAIRAPLVKASFVLAREFGWTPAECSALTVGQVMLYLEMLAGQGEAGRLAAEAAASTRERVA